MYECSKKKELLYCYTQQYCCNSPRVLGTQSVHTLGQGADWCLVQICSPSFFRFRQNARSTTDCQYSKVERRKSKSKARTATIQRVLLVSAATSGYHIGTAVPSTQPTASTATQPHRSPVNSQQANHNNSPNVLGPLFPGVRAKAKIIGDGFSMTPSRTRLEVCSQYNLKFLNPGRQRWTHHHLHGKPNNLRGSKCRRVCLLLWCICVAER